MIVDVQLLGPVGATRDGRVVSIAGLQARALLSLLALEPGRVQHFNEIVDALWPEGMPKDPRGAIHTHASRLRKAFGGTTVVASNGGYVLDIGPEQVDVGRFVSLTTEAASPGGTTRRRWELLGGALALWRGDALR